MSEPEKIKDVPKPPPEQAKEPSAPKTSQSAFDKVLEQQKVMQQSPVLQGKVSEQAASEYKVKEVVQKQEQDDNRRKGEDKDESGSRDKARQKEKGSVTVTREAVGQASGKKGFGGGASGSGGRDKGGFGGELAKKHTTAIAKKLADARGALTSLNQTTFAGKLSQAMAAKLTPQQMQALVNKIVQTVKLGKNELGQSELILILRERMFGGLRLRFTSKHGRVSIQFQTATRDAKNLFTAAAKKIQAALEEKGIAVAEVTVN